MADRPYSKHHKGACGGDTDLGDFMGKLSNFLAGTENPARFTDCDGVAREGIAYTWEQWQDDLGLTWKKFRRVLEKAEALGYIVRARRTWGKRREIRLHTAITEKYIIELTRCVSLGFKEYDKRIRATRRSPVTNVEGQHHVAHLGSTMLPTKGNTILPTKGNYIEDSSNTHIQTLQETATAADAGGAQPSRAFFPEDGEEHDPTPIAPSPNGNDWHLTHSINFGVAGVSVTTTSVELFEKLSGVGVQNACHTKTVTAQGLAARLSKLGLLVEWQRVCAEHGVPSPENVTDEQLAALSWWCSNQYLSQLAQLGREERIEHLVAGWDRHTTAFCEADERQCLKATEKPDLDFVRQVMNVCDPASPSPTLARTAQNQAHLPVDLATVQANKVDALIRLWKVECARRGVATNGFTGKMGRQLSQVLKKLPKGTAPAFVARAIQRWDEFTMWAERDYGAFNSPSVPTTAYLLKFLDAGSRLKDEEPPKPKETQTVARPKPAKPQKELPRKMTKEETLAALAEPLECEIQADQRPQRTNVYQGIRR